MYEASTGVRAHKGLTHGEVVQAVVLKGDRPSWEGYEDTVPEQVRATGCSCIGCRARPAAFCRFARRMLSAALTRICTRL